MTYVCVQNSKQVVTEERKEKLSLEFILIKDVSFLIPQALTFKLALFQLNVLYAGRQLCLGLSSMFKKYCMK